MLLSSAILAVHFFINLVTCDLRCEIQPDCNSCIQKPGCLWCSDLVRLALIL